MKKYWHKYLNMRLKNKLIIMSCTLVVLMAFIVAIPGTLTTRRVLAANSVDSSRAMLSEHVRNIEYTMQTLDEFVFLRSFAHPMQQYLAEEYEGTGRALAARQVENYAGTLIGSSPYIRSVALRDTGGETFYYDEEGRAAPGSAALEAMLQYDRAVELWGRTYWHRSAEDGGLYTSRVLFSEATMEMLGVLSVGVTPGFATPLLGSALEGGTGGLVLLNLDGAPFFESSPEYGEIAGLHLARYGVYESESRLSVDGHNYIFLKQDGGAVTVLNYIDLDAINAQALRMQWPVLLAMLLAALLAVTVAVLVSRSITRDAERLAGRMHSLSQGNFAGGAAAATHGDEIGMLAGEFDTMSARIQQLLVDVAEQSAQKKTVQLQALRHEYDALLARMNPHFLYNVLESINSMSKLDGNTRVAQSIYLLGRYLRATIDGEDRLVPLADELVNVEEYVTMHRLVSTFPIELRFEVPEPLLEATVPRMILQPVAENAILHGLKPAGGGVLRIVAQSHGADMELHVVDNGVGFGAAGQSRAAPDIHTSIGMETVDKRLKILYGEAYGVRVCHSESGADVALRLPIVLGDELAGEEDT